MIRTTLKNGLRVVMEQIPTFRSVTFGIWVRTGSRNECPENNGISHFIEHMLFKGTDRFTAKEIAETFDAIGGNVNAFTSKEYTCYYAKVLDEHLPLAVDMLADMYFHSQFLADDLEKERNVILEEIAMYEDTPDDMVHDLMSQAAYGHHPLGYSILGTEARLKSMGADDLRQYMKEHYTIENTVISVAGNIDDSTLELLEQHFGHFANHGTPSQLLVPQFHSQTMFLKKKTEQNHICLSLPGVSSSDPRMYGMVLLNNAIGGGMSSRLFQEIREKRGLAYSVYSYHSSYVDNGLFTIYAGTAPKQTKDVLDLTLEVMDEVLTNGLTDSEFQKGKEQLKGSLILSLESTSSRMNRLGKNELMLGKHYTLDEMIQRIEAVTVADMESLLAQLKAVPMACAMVGSSDKALTHLNQASN